MSQHNATEIANWFIAKAAESGDLVTHLKVQKLLYYAEAWTEVITGKELFSEQMQAWAHGPVVPEVFQEFKAYGWNALPVPNNQEVPKVSDDVLDILTQVYDTYGELPAKTLEVMTHQDEPWIAARGNLDSESRCETVIPKQKIKEYFEKKYSEQ